MVTFADAIFFIVGKKSRPKNSKKGHGTKIKGKKSKSKVNRSKKKGQRQTIYIYIYFFNDLSSRVITVWN